MSFCVSIYSQIPEIHLDEPDLGHPAHHWARLVLIGLVKVYIPAAVGGGVNFPGTIWIPGEALGGYKGGGEYGYWGDNKQISSI